MENEKEAGDKSDGVWWAVKQILREKKTLQKACGLVSATFIDLKNLFMSIVYMAFLALTVL